MVTFMDSGYMLRNVGLFVGLGLFFIAGALIHSFIAAASVGDWLKGRTVTAVDKIVSSLGVARVSFLLAGLVNMFSEMRSEYSLFLAVVKKGGEFVELSSNTCCISLFTLLIFVVCLKISNVQHAYFQHLKFIIAQRIVRLIAASVALSALHTAAFVWSAQFVHHGNATGAYVIDYSDTNLALHYVYFYTLGTAVLFLIQLTSTLLMIYFLCVHLKTIRQRSNVTVQVEPFYGAIRVSLFCFLNCTLQVIYTLVFVNYYKTLGTIFCYVTLNLFPIVHSLYLILSTTKLKNAFSRILQSGRKCMMKGCHSEPNSIGLVGTIS